MRALESVWAALQSPELRQSEKLLGWWWYSIKTVSRSWPCHSQVPDLVFKGDFLHTGRAFVYFARVFTWRKHAAVTQILNKVDLIFLDCHCPFLKWYCYGCHVHSRVSLHEERHLCERLVLYIFDRGERYNSVSVSWFLRTVADQGFIACAWINKVILGTDKNLLGKPATRLIPGILCVYL